VKIVAAVKQVAVLDEEFELLEDRPGVDPDAIDWDLNEWDNFSVEEALQLRDAAGEGEVVVVSVGGDEAEEGLRACLAKGADRAVRIWDDALEGGSRPTSCCAASSRATACTAPPGWRSRSISACLAWRW
jgi:electron transfer flavoprotein beta subunit